MEKRVNRPFSNPITNNIHYSEGRKSPFSNPMIDSGKFCIIQKKRINLIYSSFSGGDSWRNDLWTKPFLLSGFIWSLLFSEMFISSSDSHQTWFTAHQILYHFWQPTPIMPSFLQQRLIGARSQCMLHI